MYNMKQFNGIRGCVYCENPGETEAGKPLLRFWPKSEDRDRTHSSLLSDAKDAVRLNQAVSYECIVLVLVNTALFSTNRI